MVDRDNLPRRSTVYTESLSDDAIDYIFTNFDSIAEYVRESVKEDLQLCNTNKVKNNFQKYTQNVIMIGLGAIFLLFSTDLNSSIGFLLVFFLGAFFTISGLTSIFLSLRKKMKKQTKQKKTERVE